MSSICNDAVRQGWKKAADEIREPLRKQMKENLNADLDAWMERMLHGSTDYDEMVRHGLIKGK